MFIGVSDNKTIDQYCLTDEIYQTDGFHRKNDIRAAEILQKLELFYTVKKIYQLLETGSLLLFSRRLVEYYEDEFAPNTRSFIQSIVNNTNRLSMHLSLWRSYLLHTELWENSVLTCFFYTASLISRLENYKDYVDKQ